MTAEAPIGVFDSGVGGLSVLAEIRRALPAETLYYVADCGHIPYGEKSPDYIRARCRHVAAFLQARGAKALVLACNTATVAAVADLRDCYPDWPIVGMEPAVKPAAAATRNGVVGVLATTGTLQSARFAALLDQFAHGVRVVTQPCPGLVEQVERGDLDGPATRALLEGYLRPLREAGCDTLILGCTHYPFLKPLLGELLPAEVRVVDTGAAVARRLAALLDQRGLRANGPAGPTRLWSSGDLPALRNVLPRLWGEPASLEALGN